MMKPHLLQICEARVCIAEAHGVPGFPPSTGERIHRILDFKTIFYVD